MTLGYPPESKVAHCETDGLLKEITLILSTMSFPRITTPHIIQGPGLSILFNPINCMYILGLISSYVEVEISFTHTDFHWTKHGGKLAMD